MDVFLRRSPTLPLLVDGTSPVSSSTCSYNVSPLLNKKGCSYFRVFNLLHRRLALIGKGNLSI